MIYNIVPIYNIMSLSSLQPPCPIWHAGRKYVYSARRSKLCGFSSRLHHCSHRIEPCRVTLVPFFGMAVEVGTPEITSAISFRKRWFHTAHKEKQNRWRSSAVGLITNTSRRICATTPHHQCYLLQVGPTGNSNTSDPEPCQHPNTKWQKRTHLACYQLGISVCFNRVQGQPRTHELHARAS